MKGAINYIELRRNIENWLEEDMPFGDVTSDSILDPCRIGEGNLIAKEKGILCGMEIFSMVYECIDREVKLEAYSTDGDLVDSGQLIAQIRGPIASILKGERLGLNLLQRLSGIATMANQYREILEGYSTIVVDTRKTTPGLRSLEKYAVRVGGCVNHRYSLSDAVLIKDNHIAGAGGIKQAVCKAKESIAHTMKIEVEVENLVELQEAIDADVDIIMLDNMDTETMKKAVETVRSSVRPNIRLEASGNMTAQRLIEVAKTGVDLISVGALTHSVKALDISLKFVKE